MCKDKKKEQIGKKCCQKERKKDRKKERKKWEEVMCNE